MKEGMKVYIKKFLKHYYVMLVPAFLWLIFLQYRSDVPELLWHSRITIRDWEC